MTSLLKTPALAILALTLATSIPTRTAADDPRNQGVLLHMLPRRVANVRNQDGGFTVSTPVSKQKIAAMNAAETVAHLQSLPGEVTDRGIWVIYTHPTWYSDAEKAELTKLVKACEKLMIRIYTCHAAELPKGNWKLSGLIE